MRTKVLRAEEGFAQVAAAKKLADEKAARKAANPSKPAEVKTEAAAPKAEVPTESDEKAAE
jgi:small subunit ribosomal protein S6